MTETCPACGGRLVQVKCKIVCVDCGRIVEGCCEYQAYPLIVRTGSLKAPDPERV